MIRAHPRAFTLIELLLAVAILALIAAAMASAFFAVAAGSSSSNDMRSLVVRQKLLAVRLNAATRGARMVLQSGSDYTVLWVSDSRKNGLPNVSELRRIEYDAANQALRCYAARFPAGWTQLQIDVADTAYPLSSDFNTATQAIKPTGYFPAESWATGVTAWSVTLNKPTAQQARLMSVRVSVASGQWTETVVSAAALRNP